MAALALALAGALAATTATAPGMRSGLPPAPRELFRIVWQRPVVAVKALEWKPREPGGVAVDATSGMALFGTRDGWLHAVRDDGTVAWEFRTDGGFPGPPVVDGDTVYAGSSDGRLYAIALRSGKERWRYDAKEELGTRPAVVDGTVYVASLQDTVFAIDAKTGAWRWHHRREPHPGFTIRGAAPVQVVGATVYAAYSDGFVAALDRATGAARWERMVAPAGDELDVDGLVVDGSRVFAAAYSGAVIALDAATGATRWTFDAPGAVKLALAPGGNVIAVAKAGVYALSVEDGTALWSSPLDGGIPSGEPVIAGGWLLVPAGPGGLRFIEASSGRLVRVLDPGSGVSGVPAVVERRVYVLSNRGDLFALDLS
jgi:outer membrane protein assembly factor BamB